MFLVSRKRSVCAQIQLILLNPSYSTRMWGWTGHREMNRRADCLTRTKLGLDKSKHRLENHIWSSIY